MISLNGFDFNVWESGQGEDVLIFLHYFGGSSRSWTELIERLQSDFRCVAIDLRGFGKSNQVPGPFAVQQNADDVMALIEQIGPKRFWLVGHSMGGKFTLAVAARQPEGLKGVVLFAPSPPSPEPMTDEGRASLADAYGRREASEQILADITGSPLPTEIAERCIEDNLAIAPEAWRAWPFQGSREDVSEQMVRVNVPVEVVAGGEDEGLNAAVLWREVVERLPDAHLQEIPGVGHLIPLEVPDVAEAIVRAAVSGEFDRSS